MNKRLLFRPLLNFKKAAIFYYLLNIINKTLTGSGGTDTLSATFARASTATIIGYDEADVAGAAKKLISVPTGVQRFYGARFVDSTDTWADVLADSSAIASSDFLGCLIEPVSTNLSVYSENTTDWILSSTVTLVSDAVYKNVQFLKATETAINDVHYFHRSVSAAATYVCNSCFVKKGSRRYVVIITATDTRNIRIGALFDLDAGTFVTLTTPVGSPTGVAYGIDDFGDGIFRIWLRINAVGTSHNIYACLSNSASPAYNYAAPSYLGDVNEYGLFGGLQMEDAAYPSSYIKTTTASVTRNADIETIPASLFNTSNGSFRFEFTPLHNSIDTVALGGSYVDANNYTQILHTASTGWIFRKRIAGVNYDATLAGEFVNLTTYTVTATWSATAGTTITVNSVTSSPNANTAALQLGSTWQIGSDGNNLQQAGGCFKNIEVRQ